MLKFLAFRDAYLKNNNGAAAIEYGLLVAGISLVIVTVVFSLGDDLKSMFKILGGQMQQPVNEASAQASR